MSAFHDVSFPLAFALGATGGPTRRTDIAELASGRESRNGLWAGSRRRWDIGGGAVSLDEIAELTAFFEARRGRLHGFRFRDAGDWKTCLPSQNIAATDQAIGTGDGGQSRFQLVKSYGHGDSSYLRPITRPVPGTVLIALDGQLSQTGWSLDYSTGVLRFDIAPGDRVQISSGFHFDVPARFDTDTLQTSIDTPLSGRVLSLPIMEIVE